MRSWWGRAATKRSSLGPLTQSAMLLASNYTIVWALRHEEAGPSELTAVLDKASQVPAHRGMARSAAGVGLRTPWERVKDARMLLRPKDPRYSQDTWALKDDRTFRLEGCPPGASTGDLAKFRGP